MITTLAVYSAGSPSIFHGSGFRLLGQESAEVFASDIGSRQLQRSLEEIEVPGPEPGQQVAADPLGGEAAAGPAPRQHPQQGARLPPGEQDRGPAADVQPPRQNQERSGGAVQQDGRVCQEEGEGDRD